MVADSTITSLTYDNNNHQHSSSHHQHSHQSVPQSHQVHNSQYQYIQQNSRYNSSSAGNEQPDPYWDEPADSRRFTERRKKTVRFDGQDADADWGRWESERQGSQDSTTKDSGIDTSSTFTSSEDSNRGDGPKVPSLILKIFSKTTNTTHIEEVTLFHRQSTNHSIQFYLFEDLILLNLHLPVHRVSVTEQDIAIYR